MNLKKIGAGVAGFSMLALLTACSTTAPAETPETDAAPAVDIPEAIAVACTPESSTTIEGIRSRGVLEWATGISPPFTYKDTDGSYIGVEPDNAQELADILGVDLHITEYTYDLLPPALASGKADVVGAQLFDTAERREAIDFTDPYFISGQLFYVPEDSPYQTIEDLDVPENTFVFFTGNAQEGVAKEYIPNAPRVEVAQTAGSFIPYDMLATGRANSAMTEAGLMKLILSGFTSPKLAAIGLNGRVETERPAESDIINPFDVAFGYAKSDDEGWATCLNTWVEDLVSTGREAERIETWADRLEEDNQ